MSLTFKPFNHKSPSEAELRALYECRRLIQLEELPDDPPAEYEELVESLKNVPDFLILNFWFAQIEGADELGGYALIQMPTEDNTHLGQFRINLRPAYRQSEHYDRFLSTIVNSAIENDRALLVTESTAAIPFGEEMLQKLGATKAIEAHVNQLKLSEVDPTLVQAWIDRTDRSKFKIGLWEGPYPADAIDSVVELYDLFNQQPFDDLDVEDQTYTADRLRQFEKSLFGTGRKRWTIYAQDAQTGAYAGFTEIQWHPNRPMILEQGITGVFTQFRNNGLGRALKAVMLDKVLKELPDANVIRTGNADSNAPMLKINHELGFKPYKAESIWQISTEAAQKAIS